MPLLPHSPSPLGTPPPAEFTGFAISLREKKLALYLGAGISIAAGIPLSPDLVTRIAPRVQTQLQLATERLDSTTGESVAMTLEEIGDAAEARGPGVLGSLQQLIVSSVDFTSSTPTFEHKAVALLLWEGLVPVFSANWDDCIERAATGLGFIIRPTITDESRRTGLGENTLHKVHGCATQSDSLMISTSQIGSPPEWAESDVQSALSGRRVIFIGLGTVAEYVANRIEHVFEKVDPDLVSYTVVTPGDVSESWKDLLPAGAQESHVAMGGAQFLDDLLRALWRELYASVMSKAHELESGGAWRDAFLVAGTEKVLDAFRNTDSVSAISWVRRGCDRATPGKPVATGSDGTRLLLALSALTCDRNLRTAGVGPRLEVKLEDFYVECAIYPDSTSIDLVRFEQSRVDDMAANGAFGDEDPAVLHLCSGHVGALPPDDGIDDLMGPTPTDSLVRPSVRHLWRSAQNLIDAGEKSALA